MHAGVTLLAVSSLLSCDAVAATDRSSFRRVRTPFIAADPGMLNSDARKGVGALSWGIWTVDPGPRGVRIKDYKTLEASGGIAPRGGWRFDKGDWWLEEHGLIMESPTFPLASGRYVVTGGREKTAVLAVDGDKWELLDGATLHDVTHLPCRSARYRPVAADASPANARLSDFPVTPGAEMPPVAGFSKKDYAVLFVTAIEQQQGEI